MAQAQPTEILYQRPHLYPEQLTAIFDPARFSLVEAATKTGKTHGTVIWNLEQGMFSGEEGWHWWVAPVYSQAKIAYDRTLSALRSLPEHLWTKNESELTIRLANGSRMAFKSGEKPDNLYGEDVWSAVIDEACRCREATWIAVRTTLTATRGPVRMLSNVRGRLNWFHKLCGRVKSASLEGHAYHRLTWRPAVEAGILDRDEVEQARAQLPEDAFRELYEAEAADDGSNPFGLSHIRACIGAMSTDRPVAWGWDLARARDWTVGIALDAKGRVCRFHRWQRPWTECVHDIQRHTQGGRGLVDSTGLGDPVLEAVQRDQPPAMPEVDAIRKLHGGRNLHGYHFSQSSKQRLMESLRQPIVTRAITYPEGPIADELEVFEYEYSRTGVRYSAPEGYHDDCVCALALARMAWVQMGSVGVEVGRPPF